MPLDVVVRLGKLIAQKDEYAPIEGDVWDADDFAEARATRAELVHLKRLVVKGTVQVGDRVGPFEYIIGMRGGIITVIAREPCPFTPAGIFLVVRLEYERFTLPYEAPPDQTKPLTPTAAVGRAQNPAKLAEILHAARDAGGFTVSMPDEWAVHVLRPAPQA